MVEGPVLLHQHDDVLDIAQGSGGVVGGDRHGLADAGRHGHRGRGGEAGLEELAAAVGGHDQGLMATGRIGRRSYNSEP